ncbi:MAG: efflux RND transporter periplasmic adaptor subunit, partial [Geminicoccaceae bacterium]
GWMKDGGDRDNEQTDQELADQRLYPKSKKHRFDGLSQAWCRVAGGTTSHLSMVHGKAWRHCRRNEEIDMTVHARKLYLTLSALPLILLGCEEEVAEPVERVRAIKPFTVTEPAGGTIRRYPGEVMPAESSALSFAVGGTVATVEVNQGDRVTVGQVLATLDTKPFDLDIDAARSDLDAAEAKYGEAQLELERKNELYKKDWVAKAALDTAIAAAETARGSVEAARSQLGRAERNLAKTKLVAPYNGVIAERNVDPFNEVAAGSPVFGINSDDGLEVSFSVPDAVVERITGGLPVEVSVTTVNGCGCEGRITEIGSTAGAASAVVVVAALTSAPDALLPGMSAEIEMSLSGGDDGPTGYLVPLIAIAPGDQAAGGYVFKYDPEAGTVSKVAVTGSEGQDNMIAVSEGVGAGDILAAAGVSFLRDGQQVTLLGE